MRAGCNSVLAELGNVAARLAMDILHSNYLSGFERTVVAGLRHIPHGTRGKSRIARQLVSLFGNKRNVLVNTSDGDVLAVPSLLEPIAFHCLVDGVYEPEVLAVLEKQLPVGGTFLDVGTNVGVFTIAGAKCVGPSGRVIAIEASPAINRYLAHNIALNKCKNVRHIARAVTDSGPAELEFWPAPDDHFGMGSLAPQFYVEPIRIGADTLGPVINWG